MTALLGLDARLRLARLVLRTDARRRQGDLADFLTAALAGGVDLIQIHPVGLSPAAARAVLEIVHGLSSSAGAVVGVKGSAVWAGAVQVDLLQLGSSDEPTAEARQSLHPWALLGRSTHDAAQVDAAVTDDGLDFFSVGPVSSSPGLDLVRHAARVAPAFSMAAKPWFAVGGITPDTLDGVLEAGARRVCVSSAITTADDPQEAASRLKAPLSEAWRSDPASERYRFAAAASPGRSR
nr:thiamine phosphate synthase [uncultured Friedmanniella sp.]